MTRPARADAVWREARSRHRSPLPYVPVPAPCGYPPFFVLGLGDWDPGISLASVLPDDVDPELWFPSAQCGGERDYLFDAKWHTHPGRMKAYCPHRPDWPDYRISVYELPTDLPTATRYWVEGFMAGNLPEPRRHLNDEYMTRWHEAAATFAQTGHWPPELSEEPSLIQRFLDWRGEASILERLGGRVRYVLGRRDDGPNPFEALQPKD